MNTTNSNNNEIATVLDKILTRKAEEITEAQQQHSLENLQSAAQDLPACRGFTQALISSVELGRSAVIAEVKKASPSKGIIRENFHPADIAQSYEAGGASCLSVLTDRDFFQGHPDYLQAARNVVSIPVLRKDFIIDRYQLSEARVMGADCVLLIVAAFLNKPALLEDLYAEAVDLGMDVLVEVHNQAELERGLTLKPPMIGINNRNLHTFETSLQTTIDLLQNIPDGCLPITESGIHTAADIALMRSHNVHSFLVGEAFMRAKEPGQALKDLFG